MAGIKGLSSNPAQGPWNYEMTPVWNLTQCELCSRCGRICGSSLFAKVTDPPKVPAMLMFQRTKRPGASGSGD